MCPWKPGRKFQYKTTSLNLSYSNAFATIDSVMLINDKPTVFACVPQIDEPYMSFFVGSVLYLNNRFHDE